MSFRGVMQRLEMSVDRQLLAGMVARAVGVTMLTEVCDAWAGRQHEPADSGIVVGDHVAPETPDDERHVVAYLGGIGRYLLPLLGQQNGHSIIQLSFTAWLNARAVSFSV